MERIKLIPITFLEGLTVSTSSLKLILVKLSEITKPNFHVLEVQLPKVTKNQVHFDH